MKIGILTTHDEINPGAYLQAYALQRVLTKMGYANEIISYKMPRYMFREYKAYLLHRNPKILVNSFRKMLKFYRVQRRLRATDLTFSVSRVNEMDYDLIILGSDEIWNFKNCIGVDVPLYYSYGLKAKRIVSYAASFGSVTLEDKLPEHALDGLKQLERISVRDKNSRSIVERNLSRGAELVLDPTFLYDFNGEEDEKDLSDYILVYGDFCSETIRNIKEMGCRLGKKTISLAREYSGCDLNIVSVSPFEWLGYFKNASMVVTTMYHGTIFSMKYNKPFALQVTPYRKHKLETLIDIFELEGRLMVKDHKIEDVLVRDMDYTEINRKIEDYKAVSTAFLEGALNE